MWVRTTQGYADLDHIVGVEATSDGAGEWIIRLHPDGAKRFD